MSTVPESEVEIKDTSKSSKKLTMILLGLFLVVLTTGIVIFVIREMKDSKEELKKMQDEKVKLAAETPARIDEIIANLQDFKTNFGNESFDLSDSMVDQIMEANKAIKKTIKDAEELNA